MNEDRVRRERDVAIREIRDRRRDVRLAESPEAMISGERRLREKQIASLIPDGGDEADGG